MRPRNPTSPGDWLASIFARSHVAIGISRLDDGRFVAVNDAFGRLFGFRRKEIIGRTSKELGLWPVPEERTALIDALLEGKAIRDFEARFRRRSGAIGDLQISANIVTLDERQYIVGQLTDVSERRRAERALRTNETRLNTVLKISELLVFHQDRDLRYTWIANPALGSTQREVIGRSDDEIMGKEAARELVSIKRRVIRTGRGERREVWVSRGDQGGCFDLIVEPERGPDGRITGVVCAATDVSGRKRSEDHLRLQAAILANLQEGVNLVDERGILRYTNPKFDAMFGYAAGDLVGRPVAILNAPGAVSPEDTAGAITRALRRDGSWSGDIRNRRQDGSEFWTRAKIVAARHPSFGRVWISVQSDITALREAQDERDAAHRAIVELADHAQDQIEEQRREIAREVHDQIGATLTGIRMRIEALAEEGRRDELPGILALVDQALTTTRVLCSELRPPILDDLGLVETLRWYVRDWSQQTRIRAVIRLAVPATDVADLLAIDLFRMLQELLTNVARHAGARRVAVTLGRPRGVLQLRVADDGRGFPAGGAVGFGLLGVRERLRRHGGTMRVVSTPKGATVTLRVPDAMR